MRVRLNRIEILPMRRLMLLRHAKTEHDAPSGRDQDRRLDPRGHEDAAEIGSWIGHHPPFPELALVSPAVRARQTWELVWEAMRDRMPPPQVESSPDLYTADPGRMLHHIRLAGGADPRTLLLVGHNPGLHELALVLTGSGDAEARQALAHSMPTSGLVVLDFATEQWSDVAFGRGKLVTFVSPKLIKQGSGN
jgi:phosphohistidine phosphatase